MNTSTPTRNVFTVSRLSQDAHALLQGEFGTLWLEGEISNFMRAASGHTYFSLKDSRAQIRCAMFKARARYLDFDPENGQQVMVRGKLSIYQARGDFQLIAEHMELAGRGLLQQKYEQTLARLNEAGWFDAENKQQPPAYPGTIGVITSPTGAAIRDILNVLKRRYPVAQVIVYPTLVQGNEAAPKIAQALHRAEQHAAAEVLLLARGGGSLEDLWAFNEEIVATAIRDCSLPVICGVGHEIDSTIADLVADIRAPTPSAAAELAVPDIIEEKARVRHLGSALHQALNKRLSPASSALRQLRNRLQAQHPERVIAERFQRTDELERRLRRALAVSQTRRVATLEHRNSALMAQSPVRQLEKRQAALSQLQLRLRNRINSHMQQTRNRLDNSCRALDSVSPLATLGRGYAIIRDSNDKVITRFDDASVGEQIRADLREGSLLAEITETKKPTDSK